MRSLFQGVLGVSLGVSVLLLPLLLFSEQLRKKYRPQFFCFLWTVMAIRLIFPTVPQENPVIAFPIGSTEQIQWEMPEANTPQAAEEIDRQRQEVTKAAVFFSAEKIWFCTAVILLLFSLIGYWKSRKEVMRWSAEITEQEIKRELEKICCELNIRQKVRIYRCKVTNSPFLMGLFFPKIILPDCITTESQLHYVLLHELSHQRRRDILLKYLLLAVRCIHWFNPLVWLMAKQAQADIESACDAAVLTFSEREFGTTARREYGMVIFSFLQGQRKNSSILTTGFSSDKRQIIRRFEKIMDKKVKKSGVLFSALIIGATALSTVMIGCVDVCANSGEDSLRVSQEEYSKNPNSYLAEQEKLQEEISDLYSSGQIQLENGQMLWPLPNHYKIKEPYGWRDKGTDFHSGIDIVGADQEEIFGEDVVAAADGTVIYVQTDWTPGKGYGQHIILEHENGVSTLYAHLSETGVKKGDKVTAGQKIGKVGATGFAKEAHLHFEVREKENHVNPAQYLLANRN